MFDDISFYEKKFNLYLLQFQVSGEWIKDVSTDLKTNIQLFFFTFFNIKKYF